MRVLARTGEKVLSIRVGGAQVQPVLGRVVEEGKQRLGVVDHLGDRLGPLGAVVADQRLDRALGMRAVLGPDDLVQRAARAGVHALG
jgi:hypothetical protein